MSAEHETVEPTETMTDYAVLPAEDDAETALDIEQDDEADDDDEDDSDDEDGDEEDEDAEDEAEEA